MAGMHQPPHQVQFTQNSPVSAAIGLALAPIEVYTSRHPRLLEDAGVAGHQRSPRGQLASLRPGDRPPAALVRHRYREQHIPAQLLVSTAETPPFLVCVAPGSPSIRRWQSGVGMQYGRSELPRYEGRHRFESIRGRACSSSPKRSKSSRW